MLEAMIIVEHLPITIGHALAGSGFMGRIGVIFVFIGVAVAGLFVLRWLMVRRLFGAEQLTIEPARVRLGDTLTVRCSLPVKRSVRIERFALELVCREWVQYQHGTKVYRDRQEVFCQSHVALQDGDVAGGRMLTGEALLAVRPTAMHSFHARNNRIEWFVRMEVRIPKCPNVRKKWPVIVLPLLAPQAQQAQPAQEIA
jgi:hypothetical protein